MKFLLDIVLRVLLLLIVVVTMCLPHGIVLGLEYLIEEYMPREAP